MTGKAPISDWTLIKRVLPYVLRHRRWLIAVSVVMPLGVLAELAQPILLKRGIDEGITGGQHDVLLATCLSYVAVILIGFVARTTGLYGLQLIGLRALASLRTELFAHVMGQGQQFFDRRTTGSLMTRTTNDVEAIYESLAFGAVGLITDALMILGTISVMLYLDWKLTVVAFSVAPVIVFVVDMFRRRLRVLFTEIRRALSHLNGYFAEQIHGMQVIQLNGAQQPAREEFRRQAYSYLERYREANWWDAGIYAIMDGISALSVGLLIAAGGYLFGVEGSGVTIGLIVAFVDYLSKVYVPIRDFSGRFATIQRAIAALERVFGLFDSHEELARGTRSLSDVDGSIAFDDVSFSYSESGGDVLSKLSLKVRPGESLAIVGATGSGKTTIGKLLVRMYDGYKGSITIDGVEVRDVHASSVREAISVVHQDPYLFDGTVSDNIRLWSSSISDAQLKAAANLARASDFIDTWPLGYDRPITERGSNLSAGERQLINIARALARPAPIVILDEATASVDSVTEGRIDQAVEALLARKTVIVIAHRLSTIAKADRIVVLHQGKLVEQGRHAELMALNGRYRHLVESGFGREL